MLLDILLYVLYGFGVAQFATLLTTVYLHRSSTHKAVEFHPAVQFFFQLGLWIMTGINRNQWVAVHLCHHAHTDVEGDPHSPVMLSFLKVQMANPILYRRAARDPKVMELYGDRVSLSWAERNIFASKYVGFLGTSVGIVIACLIFGWWQGLVLSLSHMLFYLQLNGLVNSYCHMWGYKNFPNDHAFNSFLIAPITAGEGYHNNHHHMPGSARLGMKWYEVDLGWIFIRVLQQFGLTEKSQK